MTPTDPRGHLAPKLPPHRPPDTLEERVVDSLSRRGLITRAPGRRRDRRPLRAAVATAAGIVLIAAGAIAEHVRLTRDSATTDSRPRYALLLYGGPATDAATEQALVDEYRRWAIGIARRGHYVSGEKLGAAAREVGGAAGRSAPRTAEPLGGFFIVSAGTPAEAESIARSCPHLRHGGRIVVRPIEPT